MKAISSLTATVMWSKRPKLETHIILQTLISVETTSGLPLGLFWSVLFMQINSKCLAHIKLKLAVDDDTHWGEKILNSDKECSSCLLIKSGRERRLFVTACLRTRREHILSLLLPQKEVGEVDDEPEYFHCLGRLLDSLEVSSSRSR